MSRDYKSAIKEMYEGEFRLRLYSDLDRVKEGLNIEERQVTEKYLKSYLNSNQPVKLLNIGCGGGREAFALETMGFRVTAVDISGKMIEEAERNRENLKSNVEFICTDTDDLNFEEGTFEIIIMWNQIFENILESDDRIKTLKTCHRLLKAGGILSYTVFNSAYSFRNLRGVLKFNDSFFGPAKNFILWKIFMKLSRFKLFFSDRDLFKKRIVYINKKGFPSGGKSSGAVLAHLHDYPEIIEEINLSGFSQFDIMPYESLRYPDKYDWDKRRSVLNYITCTKN